MAEPLKNSFGPDVPVAIANMITPVYPGFDRDRFLEAGLNGYADLELTPRARHISEALAAVLPIERDEAMTIITRSLGPEIEGNDVSGIGMEVLRYLPFVFFVADYGINHFESAMTTQYELTKRFTAEFSIRTFLERYPGKTLSRLRTWASDENVHVRRLVSEGTRPRLPWAPRLRRFQEDPGPVLELLELLKDDEEEYVRRSVANNLNDIAKDHADIVVETAGAWWADGSEQRRRLVRHGLRTLIKAGDPGALRILGYGPDTPTRVESVDVEPTEVAIGAKTRITVELHNPSQERSEVLVDLIVGFVKANGSMSPRVFKGGERSLPPKGSATISKTVSLAQHTTRTHYPGTHRVDVQINGVLVSGTEFEVLEQ